MNWGPLKNSVCKPRALQIGNCAVLADESRSAVRRRKEQ